MAVHVHRSHRLPQCEDVATPEAVRNQMRAAFPALETCAIDHANAESWRAQKDRLLAVDSLQLVVTALQDSITRLEADNARAYEAGYHEAYAAHQQLTARYVAELKKPRITLGRSIELIAAAGVGFLLGEAIRD
jgi:uncharacterized small protein (DUF1192 family)